MAAATLSLRDVAEARGAIVSVVRRRYRWLGWHDAEEVIQETVLELLERHERRPETRVEAPWQAVVYAAGEAVRRLPWRERVARGELPVLAVVPNQRDGERLHERLADELAEDEVREAEIRFARETPAERLARELWTCRALGTIPGGPGEWVRV